MPQFVPVEHPRYLAGRLLTADDLEQEQAHFLGRSRRNDRFMHGWGIVSVLGGEVGGGAAVVVAPVQALDCAGNELVLATPETRSLAGLTGKHYVSIRYLEVLAGLQPSRQGDEQAQFVHVREAMQVELACVNPAAEHRDMGPGSAGCGQGHALCIASVSQHDALVAPAKRSVLR